MIMKEILRFLMSATLFTLFSSSAFARVTLAPDFKGTLVITPPSGDVTILEAGEAIPEIVTGSSLELFGENFKINADQDDHVQIVCLNHTMAVAGGASVAVNCGQDSGVIDVLKSVVHLADAAGKESNLPEGTHYTIHPQAGKQALPSAAIPTGDIPLPAAGPVISGGLPPAGDLADVPSPDSRSIQSSPS